MCALCCGCKSDHGTAQAGMPPVLRQLRITGSSVCAVEAMIALPAALQLQCGLILA